MRKAKQEVTAPRKRSTRVSQSRQDLIDERVIAEAHDESAWEAPVEVKRRGTSAGMQANLARRAAFQARLRWESKRAPMGHRDPEEAIEGKTGLMTKAEMVDEVGELVDEVARVVHLTKKQAETIVNIVFDSIVASLSSGQKKIPYFKPGKAKRGRVARADHSVKGVANSAPNETPRPS